MPPNGKYILLFLIMVAAMILLPGLLMPYNMDDAGQAQQGLYIQDMLHGGNFFLPMEHGTIFASKPPMYNWLALPFCSLFGLNEITIKIPTFFMSIGMVIVVFLFAYRIYKSRFVASISVLLLLTSYGFIRGAGIARPDMLLSLSVLAALYFFYVYYSQEPGKKQGRTLSGAYLSLAIGTLTKGPVNLVLVFAPLIIFIILDRNGKTVREAMSGFFSSAHVKGWLLFFFLVLLWFIPAVLYGKWPFVHIVFIREMFFRVVDPSQMAGRTQPAWYFLPYFIGWFMPWTIFLAGVYFTRKKIYETFTGSEKGIRLLFITLISTLIFFSIPKGKRCDYIILMYPCGAMLVAGLFGFLRANAGNLGAVNGKIAFLFRIAIALMFITGLLMILIYSTGIFDSAMVKFVTRRLRDTAEGNPHEHAMLLKNSLFMLFIGIITLLSALTALALQIRKRHASLVAVILLCFACLNMAYATWILPFFETKLSIKPFCDEIQKTVKTEGPLYFAFVNSNELFFRLGKNVPNTRIKEITRAAGEKGRVYAIMPKDKEKELEQTCKDATFRVISTSAVKKNGDYQVLVAISRKDRDETD
ncbi:MAG: phospholipid carrier-dependent glycosyltransferase [Planctomycetes bacterium]|nr:phospholipid carrier-dependent glycosyltransferase [Planctomycetota bacterium]